MVETLLEVRNLSKTFRYRTGWFHRQTVEAVKPLSFTLREGKKRQIRRMCEAVGLKVLGLKRVRIGKVKLGDLPTGQWRYLSADEQF